MELSPDLNRLLIKNDDFKTPTIPDQGLITWFEIAFPLISYS